MDLSKLSTEDLQALQRGELGRVSVDGLKYMQGVVVKDPQAERTAKIKQDANTYAGENVGEMSTTMKVLGGAKHALDKAALGVKGLLPQFVQDAGDSVDRYFGAGGVNRELVDQGNAFVGQAGTPARVGQIGADVAMTIAPGAAGMRLANAGISALPRAAQMIGTGGILPAAATGAAINAAIDPDNRGQAALTGAIGGAAGQAIGTGITRLAGGAFTPTREARALMNQGVQPSVGQATGGRLNAWEQRASSMPFLGDLVDSARIRPLDEFQAAVLRRATGAAANNIDDANAAVSRSYDAVVPSMRPTPDAVMRVQNSVRNAANNPELTPDRLAALQGIVNRDFANFGRLNGEGIKRLDSDLGFTARRYAGGSPADQTMGDEVYNVIGALREGIETGLPQDMRGLHQQANAAYRAMVPINKAASQRADERIMPRALQKALARQQNADVTRAAQDPLVDPAVRVLSNSVPDSGTAGRMNQSNSLAMLLGGVAAIPAAPFSTRAGQRALLGGYSWQDPIRQLGSEYLVPALRNIGTSIGN
jgi:hypothetical protein